MDDASVPTSFTPCTASHSMVSGAMAVSLSASLGIWGGTRYVDLSQEGRGVIGGFALLVGVIGLLANIAIIALGIFLMVSK